MEIKKTYDVYHLYAESWAGARDTIGTIMKYNKEDDFMSLFDEMFYERIPDLTEVNDWLWFDGDAILESLGINEEEDEIE